MEICWACEMAAGTLQVDNILRGELGRDDSRAAIGRLALAVVLFGLLYGASMGTYSGIWGERLLQVLYSAVKVPLLLGVTFIVALPSFWVLNRLLGLGDDFAQVLRALVATQAALTIILASLAPFTLLCYASWENYPGATLFNAMAFAIAAVSAQLRLSRYYRPLIARNPRHRAMQALWLVIYSFVGIQMGWTLRPFIGNPEQPVQFFRSEPFTNAYTVIAKLVWTMIQ